MRLLNGLRNLISCVLLGLPCDSSIRPCVQLILADPAAVAYIMNKKIYDYREACFHISRVSLTRMYTVAHSDVSRPRIRRMLGESLGWVEGESEHKRMQGLVSANFSFVLLLCKDLQRVFIRRITDMTRSREEANISSTPQHP